MTGTGEVTEVLRLRPGVYRGTGDTGETMLLTHRSGMSLRRLDPSEQAVLERLAAGPVPAPECAIRAPRLLERLRAGGWLSITVTVSGREHHTVVPHRRPASVPVADVDLAEDAADRTDRLSRFAVLRRDGDGHVLEHPDAWGRVVLHGAAALAALAPPVTAPGGARLWRDLHWTGIAESGEEQTEPRWRQWAPHERWFHHRSRMGDHQLESGGFGGTGWARERFPPVPWRRPSFPGPASPLAVPDLAARRASDPSLTAVLEDRRSIRWHDDSAPITVDQLGELLFRCARNRGTQRGRVSRPYPAAGSYHELEIYPVVRLVRGLAEGMYHYDPQQHRLERVSHPDPPVERLLRTAAQVAGIEQRPQVLLVVAARFGRLMLSYEQMAYALVLKDVGVLFNTVYSVATAMGLAVCALGTGDAAAFAAATHLDPAVEGSVGELTLGSLRADDA